MAFKLGNTHGTGRVKGSKNKTTANVRKAFQEMINSNIDQFENDLKSIEPGERLKILVQMARLILPPLKQTFGIEQQAEQPIFQLHLGNGTPPTIKENKRQLEN